MLIWRKFIFIFFVVHIYTVLYTITNEMFSGFVLWLI
jgi:surface polysaccharide O-acyltransferase-like enzyme